MMNNELNNGLERLATLMDNTGVREDGSFLLPEGISEEEILFMLALQTINRHIFAKFTTFKDEDGWNLNDE